MDLLQAVKQLPQLPGVYLMKDMLDNIIYVGKARKLRSRVSQYFQSAKDFPPKIKEMTRNIRSFEYITADTELDAFLLECKLIKEMKPKYNKQMKNDKKYNYIRISMKEEFPRISIVTGKTDNQSAYFGPYTSLNRVENTVEFIKENFQIRKCYSGSIIRKSSGCLNYHLGKCLGACMDGIDKEEYSRCINHIILFLEGDHSVPVRELQRKMEEAVENLEFEKAAQYRDHIKGIRHVMNKQKLIRSSLKGRNIIAVEPMDDKTAKLFFVRSNKLLFSEAVVFRASCIQEIHKHLKKLTVEHFESPIETIGVRLSQQDIDEAQIIFSYLRRKRNSIMSFWIPANWLEEGNESINAGITRMIERILSKRQGEENE
jgi:excinuclease ABC subunit C